MIPFSSFAYFGVLLYVALPTLVLGAFRRAGRHWALFATVALIAVQYWEPVHIRGHLAVHAFWFVALWALFQALIARSFLLLRARGPSRLVFYCALGASLLPLFVAKAAPVFSATTQFGFLGISYVTFRSLDLIFCIQDRVVTAFSLSDFFGFLLFFPTISSGPIDRFRRFSVDWRRTRTRAEFLGDLGEGMHRIFRGFLYKFILAYLIERYWMNPAGNRPGVFGALDYMYAYTFYLFFDFAGYSAFAIGVGYFFGIHTPENFDRPFLARNIRDFWNRWHISLSFWFRDHVYMRFVFAAMRGKWFKNKHTASILAYYLSFGLMGLWHGFSPHYILYGFYHGTLLSGYDIFSRWNKQRQVWRSGPLWSAASVLLTFHAFAFGLLLFSGHLTSSSTRAITAPPHSIGVLEKVGDTVISGWAWNEKTPDTPIEIVIMEDKHILGEMTADQYRQDLADEGRGNGRHGFTFDAASSPPRRPSSFDQRSPRAQASHRQPLCHQSRPMKTSAAPVPPASRFNASLLRSPGAATRILLAAAFGLLLPLHEWAAERQVLHGHVPAVVSRLVPVGRLPVAQHVNLAIGLPPRNQQGLTDLIRRISDPASPDYRHYLTPQEFAARFGPSEQDYETVAAFAKAHGLTVTRRYPNRVVLDVGGAVSDIEKALHVTMRLYKHPTEGRVFYAPDTEPSLDLAVPLSHISGLDNYALPEAVLQADAGQGRPGRQARHRKRPAGHRRRKARRRLGQRDLYGQGFPRGLRSGCLVDRLRAGRRVIAVRRLHGQRHHGLRVGGRAAERHADQRAARWI